MKMSKAAGAAMAGISVALMAMPAAAAGDPAQDPHVTQLEAQMLALVGGLYQGHSCQTSASSDGPGSVLIARNTIAQQMPPAGPRLALFDPAATLGINVSYPNHLLAHRSYDFEYTANGHAFHVSWSGSEATSPVFDFGEGNLQEGIRGMHCQPADLNQIRLATSDTAVHELMLAIYGTGGQWVTGFCRAAGKLTGPARRVQFRVLPQSVEIDGVPLPFSNARNPLARESVGVVMADGTVNGGFEWADRSMFHGERDPVSGTYGVFAYRLAAKPELGSQFCMMTEQFLPR